MFFLRARIFKLRQRGVAIGNGVHAAVYETATRELARQSRHGAFNRGELLAALGGVGQRCEQLLDRQADAAQAAQQVRALMFIERFAADVEARFDQMETASRGQ